MTVSRDRVSDIIDFFNMTKRKCIVIWERTAPDSKNPTVEISSSCKNSNFFEDASIVLHNAAISINEENGEGKDFTPPNEISGPETF